MERKDKNFWHAN